VILFFLHRHRQPAAKAAAAAVSAEAECMDEGKQIGNIVNDE
jgi:hypothetical protein